MCIANYNFWELWHVLPFPTGAVYEVITPALCPKQAVYLFLTAALHNLVYELKWPLIAIIILVWELQCHVTDALPILCPCSKVTNSWVLYLLSKSQQKCKDNRSTPWQTSHLGEKKPNKKTPKPYQGTKVAYNYLFFLTEGSHKLTSYCRIAKWMVMNARLFLGSLWESHSLVQKM